MQVQSWRSWLGISALAVWWGDRVRLPKRDRFLSKQEYQRAEDLQEFVWVPNWESIHTVVIEWGSSKKTANT